MVLVLCSEDGCGRSIPLASRAVAALWRPWCDLLYQIMLTGWSLFSAEDKIAAANNTDRRPQHCTLMANKTWLPSDPVSSGNTAQNGLTVYLKEEQRGKEREREKKNPISLKAIMHLSQQQVELQSQSFIFNSTRVSGQTNVLLISSLLLLKRGRDMRGRKLDYRELDWKTRGGKRKMEGGENRVQ